VLTGQLQLDGKVNDTLIVIEISAKMIELGEEKAAYQLF